MKFLFYKHTGKGLQSGILLYMLLTVGKIAAGFMTGAVMLVADGCYSGIYTIAFFRAYAKKKQRIDIASAQWISCFMQVILMAAAAGIIWIQFIRYPDSLRIMPEYLYGILLWTAVVTFLQAAVIQFLRKEITAASAVFFEKLCRESKYGVCLTAAVATSAAMMKITGWLQLDVFMGGGIILYMLYRMIRMCWNRYGSVQQLPLDELEKRRIGRIILDTPGVLGYHKLKACTEYTSLTLSFHLEVSRELPVYQAYAVSDAVSMSLLLKYGSCVPVIHLDRK